MTTTTRRADELSQDQLLEILNLNAEGSTYSDNNGEVRDPRTGRIIRGGDGSDDGLIVEFSVEAVFNKTETVLNGRNTYTDMEFITIRVPADKLTIIHTPVTEYHKWRFPVDYQRFKDGLSDAVSGTPIGTWAYLSPSQRKDLEVAGFRTVEQIANMSDTHAPSIRGFYELKRKAAEFLKVSEDSFEAGRLQAELEQRDAQHRAEIDAMRHQMAEMMSLLTTKTEATDQGEPDDKPKTRFGKPIKPKAE